MDTNQFELLQRLAKGIKGLFGERREVAIHDFRDLARSVVHIEGTVTNRSVGAPVTPTMMDMLNEFGQEVPDKIAYKITTADGKVLRCATIFVRDADGRLEGCLAINLDISDFMFFSRAFSDLLFNPDGSEDPSQDMRVDFSRKPERSMEATVDATVTDRGRPPAMMDKAEKIEIVRELENKGCSWSRDRSTIWRGFWALRVLRSIII
jgi:predicted transcriptional regulator YheO